MNDARLMVYLPKEQRRQLKQLAVEQDCKVNDIMLQAILIHLEKHRPKKKGARS